MSRQTTRRKVSRIQAVIVGGVGWALIKLSLLADQRLVAVLLAVAVLVILFDAWYMPALRERCRRHNGFLAGSRGTPVSPPSAITATRPRQYAEDGQLLDSGKLSGFHGTGDAVANKWQRRRRALTMARPASIPPGPSRYITK